MTLGVIIVYLLVLLGIGWWVGRTKISGVTDYLLAGRSMGLGFCTAALAATHFGGGMLLGVAEQGYERGLSGAWYGIATGIGLILLGFFTAERFRSLSLFTVPDYLAHRYGGKGLRVLGASLSVIALIGILAAQVGAATSAFSMAGLPGDRAAVLATIVFILYTTLGGLWAASISDAFQVLLATIGVLVAAVVVSNELTVLGGFEKMLASGDLEANYFKLFSENSTFILWILLPTVMYTLIGQDFYQRLFGAKNAKVAKRSAIFAGVFLIAISFLPAYLGMGARALSGGVIDGKGAFPWILTNLMSPLLGGIIIATVLAAVMSTADSLLTAATSHVIQDIWIKTFPPRKEYDEKTLLKLSRTTTIFIGFVALLIGTQIKGIIDALIYSYSMYTAGVLVPVLGGVLWKGGSRRGAMASMVVGSALALGGILGEWKIGAVPVEIYAAAFSAIVFVIASLGSKKN